MTIAMARTCSILGATVETGASRPGCRLGPESLRAAGLAHLIQRLDWSVSDLGDVTVGPKPARPHDNAAIHHLAETSAWIEALIPKARDAVADFDLSIFLGGDHSLSAGTVTGVAEYAAACGRPLYVLWLDAHPDLHTLFSTESGNLHGTPAGYFIGLDGFDAYPKRKATVSPDHLCLLGLRAIDPAEARVIAELGLQAHSTAALRQHGPAVLQPFLDRVRADKGLLHVSFDVDILDPGVAPGIGTPAPDGTTLEDIQRIMAVLRASGLVTSLDLVELNPLLDRDAQTAMRICDVVAALLSRPVDAPVTSLGTGRAFPNRGSESNHRDAGLAAPWRPR